MSRLLLTLFKENSRRVVYLQAAIKDSNFCKALPFHNFRTRGARESLRREFGTGRQTDDIKRRRCEALVSRKSSVFCSDLLLGLRSFVFVGNTHQTKKSTDTFSYLKSGP